MHAKQPEVTAAKGGPSRFTHLPPVTQLLDSTSSDSDVDDKSSSTQDSEDTHQKEFKSELNIQVMPKLYQNPIPASTNTVPKPTTVNAPLSFDSKVKKVERTHLPFHKSVEELAVSNFSTFPMVSDSSSKYKNDTTMPRASRSVRFEETPSVRNIMEVQTNNSKKYKMTSNMSKSLPSLSSPTPECKLVTSITEAPSPSYVEYTNIQPVIPPTSVPHMFHSQAPVVPIISNGIAYIPVQMSSPQVSSYFLPNSFPLYSPTSPKHLRGAHYPQSDYSRNFSLPLANPFMYPPTDHYNKSQRNKFPDNITPDFHSLPSNYLIPDCDESRHSSFEKFDNLSSFKSDPTSLNCGTPQHPISVGGVLSTPKTEECKQRYKSVYANEYNDKESTQKPSTESDLSFKSKQHSESRVNTSTQQKVNFSLNQRLPNKEIDIVSHSEKHSSGLFCDATCQSWITNSSNINLNRIKHESGANSSARKTFLKKSIETLNKAHLNEEAGSVETNSKTLNTEEGTAIPPPVNYSTLPTNLQSPSWMEIFNSTPPLLETYSLQNASATCEQVFTTVLPFLSLSMLRFLISFHV